MATANSYPLHLRGADDFGAIHEEILVPGRTGPINLANQPTFQTQYPPHQPLSPASRPLLDFEEGKKDMSRFKNTVYYPYFTYSMSLLNVAVMAFQLYNCLQLTGSLVQTQPFNFLMGPPIEVLINQGGRFLPCMKQINTTKQNYRCPADSNRLPSGTAEYQSTLPKLCSIEQVCGLGGFKSGVPDQWFRFITPMFLHGGVVHLLLNVITLLALGTQLERTYGPFRIAFVYLSAGVGGFFLGANLSPVEITSVGASGAIFGLIACDLVDLFINWDRVLGPWCELFKVTFGIIVTFALGLLPIVDNFSHIGGFIAGLFASGCVMPSCRVGKRTHTFGFLIFFSILSGVLLALGFYFSITGFYFGNWAKACPKCQYLNCLPIGNLCENYQFP